MSATIVSVTVAAAEKAIQISNGSLFRELAIGSDWTELFVGVGMAVDDSTPPTTGSAFYIGASDGTAFDSGGSHQSVGWGVTSGATWTGSTGGYSFNASAFKKLGSTLTIPSSDSAWMSSQSRLATKTFWNGVALRLKKTATANAIEVYAMKPIADASINSTRCFDYDRLILAAEAGNLTSANSILGSSTIGFSDVIMTDRDALTHFFATWNRSSSLLNIGHVVCAKWA